jgi:hypothetical protein
LGKLNLKYIIDFLFTFKCLPSGRWHLKLLK